MKRKLDKASASGFMEKHHEVARFENLFFKIVGSAYYAKDWGLDWSLWLSQGLEFPLGSLLSYIRQEATKKGIIITQMDADIKDFKLNLRVEINGIKFELESKVNRDDII
ncbi:TPA: hypothetical protein P0E12_004957 [Vibrio harveyi]|nr:hypothetical protein [Vibrio harveyi]